MPTVLALKQSRQLRTLMRKVCPSVLEAKDLAAITASNMPGMKPIPTAKTSPKRPRKK